MRPSLLALLGAALAMVALVLLVQRDGARSRAGAAPSQRDAASALERAEAELAEGAPSAAPPGNRTPAETGGEEATAADEGRAARAPERDTVWFSGQLVLPDRTPVRADYVRATLTASDGVERVFEGRGAEAVIFDGVPPGTAELRVAAPGYAHRAETLDLSREPAGETGSGRRSLSERVTLWPNAWLPVIVLTRDGRPFRVLAEERGLEPKRLFADAFHVAASRAPQPEGSPLPAEESEVARFRPPPGYQNVEVTSGVAGSLELLAPPPLFAGLWLHGAYLDGRWIDAGTAELVFELDEAALDARLARVTARLVDRDSGAPVSDAIATLKADTSAHRRADLSDVAPDETGLLAFERVIPGQHELSITRAGNLVQRRFSVAPAEHLDLGDVPIGAGPGVPIRLVDSAGRPALGVIEVAPHEPGRYAEDLYPPNLHRHTDSDGRYELPLPDVVSIVRARVSAFEGEGSQYPRIATRNVLIDPSSPPPELVLVLRYPLELRVEPAAPLGEAGRLVIEDQLGIAVAILARGDDLEAELFPGPYDVRRLDGDDLVGVAPVIVADGAQAIPAP